MVAYRNFGGDDHAAGLDYDGDFILVDASGGGELFLQGGGVGVVVRAAARSHREHHGISVLHVVQLTVLLEQRVDLVVGQRRVPHGEVRHLAMEVATGIELGKVHVARV